MRAVSNKAIAAVSVNHGTPLYAELMLRSLLARNPSLPNLSIALIENPVAAQAPEPDTQRLHAFAASSHISVAPSLLSPGAAGNSHGENLRDFVLAHPDCDYYLFVDTDIVFIEDDTLLTMLTELEQRPTAFGIQARLSQDGLVEQPMGSLHTGGTKVRYRNQVTGASWEAVKPGTPAPHQPMSFTVGGRIHPCCCLLRNSEILQRVARYIGFSCAAVESTQDGKWYDTMGLATQVMRTHGLAAILSSAMVQHFVGVSCQMRTPEKDRQVQALLESLRRLD